MPSDITPSSLYWDACVFLSYVNEDVDRYQDIDTLFGDAR